MDGGWLPAGWWAGPPPGRVLGRKKSPDPDRPLPPPRRMVGSECQRTAGRPIGTGERKINTATLTRAQWVPHRAEIPGASVAEVVRSDSLTTGRQRAGLGSGRRPPRQGPDVDWSAGVGGGGGGAAGPPGGTPRHRGQPPGRGWGWDGRRMATAPHMRRTHRCLYTARLAT